MKMKAIRLKNKHHKFNYLWSLKDANFTKDKGTVFSCFAGCGGSSMGYKLAGYDVIGCNEIDKKMIKTYRANLNPKYSFMEAIQTFKLRDDLPKELYNLAILDGSPPCSTFSAGGDREKAWGVKRKFKEGQVEQVLDTLFFDFIDLANKLQPKIVVAENVKGLMHGSAIKYLHKVHSELDKAGYNSTSYLLDSSKMGVPQKRERVFVIGIRKDIAKDFLQKDGFFGKKLGLNLEFNEREIPVKSFVKAIPKSDKANYLPHRYGDVIVNPDKPLATVVTIHRYWLNEKELIDNTTIAIASSFPTDYDYSGVPVQYATGMSVPPVAMANISSRLYEQILSKI